MANINYALCFGFLLMLGSGMNITSATSISREGKNFYLSKIIPVDYTTQVKAKVYLSLIINLITVLIGYIISIFVYRLSVIEIVFFPIVLGLYSYGYALSTIRFDLKQPKLNWTTPNEAVKNNQRATIPTLINMAISFVIMIILIVLYVMLSVLTKEGGIENYVAVLIKIGAWIVVVGGAVAFAAVARIRLFGSVIQLYENIEV
jgi:ABC-2 type transport system permease protein